MFHNFPVTLQQWPKLLLHSELTNLVSLPSAVFHMS